VKIALLVVWPPGVTILTGPVTAPAGRTAVIKPLAFTVNSAVVVPFIFGQPGDWLIQYKKAFGNRR
jgi:hypothetical protein